jgi:hypothetical protein
VHFANHKKQLCAGTLKSFCDYYSLVRVNRQYGVSKEYFNSNIFEESVEIEGMRVSFPRRRKKEIYDSIIN